MDVNYIDSLAREIRRRVPKSELPDEDTHNLFRIYAVLLLAKGTLVQPEDIHNAWVAWMLDINPSHESLVPYSELDPETASGDDPYVQAIRALAEKNGTPEDV